MNPNFQAQDNRFGSMTVGEGSEFNVAVTSCHKAHPEIPIYLLTNALYLDPDVLPLIYKVLILLSLIPVQYIKVTLYCI